MAVVDTVLAPREVLNRLYERIRALYDKILRADTRRAQSDRAMEAEIEQINALVKKLDFSFIRKVMNDASASKQSYQEVKEFEKLLDEITAESKYAVRQEHYIYRTAKSVRRYHYRVRSEHYQKEN